MGNARLRGIPLWQFFDATGAVLASGTLNFYVPGTTTDKDIYKDTGKAATADNPVTLDAAGRVPYPLFGDGFYDVVVKNSAGTTQMTISNWGDDWSAVGTDLSANPLSNHSFETSGTGGEPFANWTKSGTTITRETTADTGQQHGTASAKFVADSTDAPVITSDVFEIDELQELRLEFDIKASNASAQPKIEIDWLDSAQGALSSSTIYSSTEGLTPTSWTRIRGLNVTPVTNAKYSTVTITGDTAGSGYTINFDNLVVSQVNAFSNEVPYTVFGMKLSRDAGDTSHDINVTAGACKDATYAEDIILPTEMTKQCDAGWAVGDDAGGMESGGSMPTDGLLYVWAIKNPTTGNVDILISASATAPTMPIGYTVKRRIGSWRTDATSPGNLLDGFNFGDMWWWNDTGTAQVVDTTIVSGTSENITIDAPPNSIVHYMARVEFTDADQGYEVQIKISPTGATWTDEKFSQGIEIVTNEILDEFWCRGVCPIDSSSQLTYEVFDVGVTDTNIDFDLYIWGYHDIERDNP
jgi:hypothetical protein